METAKPHMEELLEKLEIYGHTRLELFKLKALDAFTGVVSILISRLVVLILFFCFFLLVSLGLALWIGEILGKVYYGIFVVGAFYMLIGIVFHLFLYRWIRRPLSDFMIAKALKQTMI
jgi:hypothetical protein